MPGLATIARWILVLGFPLFPLAAAQQPPAPVHDVEGWTEQHLNQGHDRILGYSDKAVTLVVNRDLMFSDLGNPQIWIRTEEVPGTQEMPARQNRPAYTRQIPGRSHLILYEIDCRRKAFKYLVVHEFKDNNLRQSDYVNRNVDVGFELATPYSTAEIVAETACKMAGSRAIPEAPGPEFREGIR